MSVRAISTNVGFKIPKNYFGNVQARSSFAMQFTDVSGSVIDSDYRGLVVVNFSNITFEVRKGQRFTEVIFQKISHPVLTEVQAFVDSRTVRKFGVLCSSGDSVQKKCLTTS